MIDGGYCASGICCDCPGQDTEFIEEELSEGEQVTYGLYCSSQGALNYKAYHISRVKFNTIDNPSDHSYYSDFTSVSVPVEIDKFYELNVTVLTDCSDCGGDNCVRAWIDWNQDYIFDASEQYDVSKPDPVYGCPSTRNVHTFSTTIKIPLSAMPRTRMRISLSKKDPPGPCGQDGWGLREVEDYTIEVKFPDVDYIPPVVSIIGAPSEWTTTDATAEVDCYDVQSGCNLSTYKLKIYDSDPSSCPTVYEDYDLDLPQTISSHKWVCGAAKDKVGNIGFSSPVEFKVDKSTDLRVTNISWTPSNPWNEDIIGQDVFFNITVKNVGESEVCSLDTVLYLDDQQICSASETHCLSLGDEYTLECGNYNEIELTKGPHKLKASVNPDNVINELEETIDVALCWPGYKYIRGAYSKFCQCVTGTYGGYSGGSSGPIGLQVDAYAYEDTGNNENWRVKYLGKMKGRDVMTNAGCGPKNFMVDKRYYSSATRPTASEPDLVVEYIQIFDNGNQLSSPLGAGKTFTIKTQIKNQGAHAIFSDSQKEALTLYIEDSKFSSLSYADLHSISDIPAGETRTYTFKDKWKPSINVAGLKVEVDVNNEIKEVDEDNNIETIRRIIDLPEAFTWKNYKGKNWMTPVKDQMGPTCMAYAIVGAVEAVYKIEKNNATWDPDLSERHLFKEGEGRINFLKTHGIVDEDCVSWGDTELCPDWESRLWNITSYGYMDYYGTGKKDRLKIALIENGPMYVAVNMGNVEVDHAVVLVGYDAISWTMKNSWGEDYGVNGYFAYYYSKPIFGRPHYYSGVNKP